MQGINEDLSIDDNLDSQESDLEKQFLHPGYTWRGLKLKPYTISSRQLFKQVMNFRDDEPSTFFLKFIFIHVFDNREKLIELCWDKAKFHAAFLDWLDSLGSVTDVTAKDDIAAMELYEEICGWVRKSSVEVIPDPGLPEKKTKATGPQKSPA
jgi:hypothetical protein